METSESLCKMPAARITTISNTLLFFSMRVSRHKRNKKTKPTIQPNQSKPNGMKKKNSEAADDKKALL